MSKDESQSHAERVKVLANHANIDEACPKNGPEIIMIMGDIFYY